MVPDFKRPRNIRVSESRMDPGLEKKTQVVQLFGDCVGGLLIESVLLFLIFMVARSGENYPYPRRPGPNYLGGEAPSCMQLPLKCHDTQIRVHALFF